MSRGMEMRVELATGVMMARRWVGVVFGLDWTKGNMHAWDDMIMTGC